MLPTDLASALRRDLDSCNRLRVGCEAVADGTLLALPQRDVAYGCQWGALVPHLTGRHTYITPPLPAGHPRPACYDLIVAFHDHGILSDNTWQEVRQKTLGRDYRRRVRARLLELRDPLRQRWDDIWLCRLGRWPPGPSPPTLLPPLRRMRRGVLCHADGRQQVHAVLPGGRVPLARTIRGPAQAHGRGGVAPAHRGRTKPIAWPRGPRGCRSPVDPRAPAGPHVRRTPVARVRTLGPGGRRGDGGYEAHAAAQHDPAGSARTFLGEAALPAVRALNGAGPLWYSWPCTRW